MFDAMRLTYRIHRFEIVVALVVAGLAAVGLGYLTKQMVDIGIPDGCWPFDQAGDYGLPECEDLLARFWDVESSGGGWARAGLAFLGPMLGVLLGVSLVAREIELRTAELAWSLSRRRSRWLLQRLLPMLAIALVILVVMGFMGWWYFDAQAQARHGPELTELASQGVSLVARGLLAMGVALLFGAIAGRTMPALVAAVIAVVAWSLVVVPASQGAIADERAMWQNEADLNSGAEVLLYLDNGLFDASRPGQEDEPGKRLTNRQQESLFTETCGPYPEDEDSDDADSFFQCELRFWEETQWTKVVPRTSFGYFQTVDTFVSLLIAGGTMLLTFPVVARRRPN